MPERGWGPRAQIEDAPNLGASCPALAAGLGIRLDSFFPPEQEQDSTVLFLILISCPANPQHLYTFGDIFGVEYTDLSQEWCVDGKTCAYKVFSSAYS